MMQNWPLPYVPVSDPFAIDAFVGFCLGVLLAVLVNAEAQAFIATLLGDFRKDAKDRFNFNAFLHLDIIGTINFFLGGFGWARQIEIDPTRFKYPRLHNVLTRLAGPIANFVLANIAASIIAILKSLDIQTRVLPMVAGVNITAMVYNLLPLPPLVAGVLLTVLIPERFARTRMVVQQAGPFAILTLTLVGLVWPQFSLHPHLDPLVRKVYGFIAGS